MSPAHSASAQIIRGTLIRRCVVIVRLGAGAMGMVYAAYDRELDRKGALKLLESRQGDTAEERVRLLREAQALAKLDHPNVVSVYDVDVHETQVFVAMEFFDGQTLRAWMDVVPEPGPGVRSWACAAWRPGFGGQRTAARGSRELRAEAGITPRRSWPAAPRRSRPRSSVPPAAGSSSTTWARWRPDRACPGSWPSRSCWCGRSPAPATAER